MDDLLFRACARGVLGRRGRRGVFGQRPAVAKAVAAGGVDYPGAKEVAGAVNGSATVTELFGSLDNAIGGEGTLAAGQGVEQPESTGLNGRVLADGVGGGAVSEPNTAAFQCVEGDAEWRGIGTEVGLEQLETAGAFGSGSSAISTAARPRTERARETMWPEPRTSSPVRESPDSRPPATAPRLRR